MIRWSLNNLNAPRDLPAPRKPVMMDVGVLGKKSISPSARKSATNYLGSAFQGSKPSLSLISKISHSNSTKLGKFYETPKKIGAVKFHLWPKTARLIISDENSGLGLVFPWLAELPPPAFSEPGGKGVGSEESYQPSEGWDPWQDVLQCRLSSWPGLHPQGWEALAINKSKLVQDFDSTFIKLRNAGDVIVLMVQKSHSQPPGMYKTLVKNGIFAISTGELDFFHQLYQVISSHI